METLLLLMEILLLLVEILLLLMEILLLIEIHTCITFRNRPTSIRPCLYKYFCYLSNTYITCRNTSFTYGNTFITCRNISITYENTITYRNTCITYRYTYIRPYL